MIANSPFAPQDPRGVVHQGVADALGRRLVDEEVAGVLLGVGVPGDDLDAARPRLAQHRGDGDLVLHAHRDDVDAAGDPGLDHLVLLGGVEVGGAIPERARPRFPGRLFGALAAADEVGIAFGLGHHGDDRLALARGRAARPTPGARCRARRSSRSERTEQPVARPRPGAPRPGSRRSERHDLRVLHFILLRCGVLGAWAARDPLERRSRRIVATSRVPVRMPGELRGCSAQAQPVLQHDDGEEAEHSPEHRARGRRRWRRLRGRPP